MERTCAICRIKKDKADLYRFAVSGDSLVFDPKQDMKGRGVYVCSKECWELARFKRRRVKVDSKSPKGKYIAVPDAHWDDITK